MQAEHNVLRTRSNVFYDVCDSSCAQTYYSEHAIFDINKYRSVTRRTSENNALDVYRVYR
jgi:hypothetical protein